MGTVGLGTVKMIVRNEKSTVGMIGALVFHPQLILACSWALLNKMVLYIGKKLFGNLFTVHNAVKT